ncbi:MAG TPA: hypothetical protein VD907_00145 [Verrucomicrobiae bacterium]|nr:hypothetical protein [Verrucomicrobiae bacterium]
MNNLRQKSWYYAVLITLEGAVVSVVALVGNGLLNQPGVLRDFSVNPVGFFAVGGAAVALLTIFLFDKLSRMQNHRIAFLLHSPFLWQLIVFILCALIVISVVTALRSVSQSELLAALDIGLNVTYAVFSLYVLYRVLATLFRK